MKTLNKLCVLAAAALSLAACKKDNDIYSSFRRDSNAVHFDIAANEMKVSELEARSDIFALDGKNIFEKGDRIAIAAGSMETVTYEMRSDGSWYPENFDSYLTWSQARSTEFSAYYPVDVNDASMTTFTVPDIYESEKDLQYGDYMTYSTTTDKVKKVSLNMERKMACLIVNIDELVGKFAEGYEVAGVEIHVNSVGYENGEVKRGDKYITPFKKTDESGITSYYAMVAPTTEKEYTDFITVTLLNTADNTYSVAVIRGIPEMEAGNIYQCILYVGNDTESIAEPYSGEIFNRISGQMTTDMIKRVLGDDGSILYLEGAVDAADWHALDVLDWDWQIKTLDLTEMKYAGGYANFNINLSSLFALETITLPGNMTVIGDNFMTSDDLSFITSVTFPGNIKSIGSKALTTCGYSTDPIPSISLRGCTGVPTLGADAFGDAEVLGNSTYHRVVYVKDEAMAAKFLSDASWQKYLYDATTRPGGIEIRY